MIEKKRVGLTTTELFPVYIRSADTSGPGIDLTYDEIVDYEETARRYFRWQQRLQEAWEENFGV
jgi:hypothetical protein